MPRLTNAFPDIDKRKLRDDFEEFVRILVQQQILVNDPNS
jgi:hypothetical protein